MTEDEAVEYMAHELHVLCSGVILRTGLQDEVGEPTTWDKLDDTQRYYYEVLAAEVLWVVCNTKLAQWPT